MAYVKKNPFPRNKLLHIRITEGMDNRLRDLSDKSGLTVTKIVEMSIQNYLENLKKVGTDNE